MNEKRLKETLGHVCRDKKGNLHDLQDSIGDEAITQFTSVGFIKPAGMAWIKTPFADRFYKDMFGYWAFFIHVKLKL